MSPRPFFPGRRSGRAVLGARSRDHDQPAPCRRRAHGSGPRPGGRSPRGSVSPLGLSRRTPIRDAPGRSGGQGEPESVTGEEL